MTALSKRPAIGKVHSEGLVPAVERWLLDSQHCAARAVVAAENHGHPQRSGTAGARVHRADAVG